MWAELDERLAQVDPELAWEIGPADGERLFLAISPDLIDELLARAQAVLDAAYTSELWDFRLGRQRRPWSDVLQMAQGLGGEGPQAIDLANWTHLAFRGEEEGRLDVVLAAQSPLDMSEDDQDELATIVVTGLLGELCVMQRVGSIELLEQFEPHLIAKAKPAVWLPYAFGMQPLPG